MLDLVVRETSSLLLVSNFSFLNEVRQNYQLIVSNTKDGLRFLVKKSVNEASQYDCMFFPQPHLAVQIRVRIGGMLDLPTLGLLASIIREKRSKKVSRMITIMDEEYNIGDVRTNGMKKVSMN